MITCSDGLDISFVASQFGGTAAGSGGDGMVLWLRSGSTSLQTTGRPTAGSLLYARTPDALLSTGNASVGSATGMAGGLLGLALDKTGEWLCRSVGAGAAV